MRSTEIKKFKRYEDLADSDHIYVISKNNHMTGIKGIYHDHKEAVAARDKLNEKSEAYTLYEAVGEARKYFINLLNKRG